MEFIVQQRHDGLVQRAGFRERELLEFYPELGRPAQALQHQYCKQSSQKSSDHCCYIGWLQAETEEVRRVVDNADLVLVIGPQNGHSRLMCERLATTSRSGLKYEDGGSLGFVVAESGEWWWR